jgi:predicted SprT family Zn-dependent metalloprotease
MPKAKRHQPPTNETYPGLQRAFDWFNTQLFRGALPPVLITLQRKKGAGGYFSPERFAHTENGGKPVHEIALNPQHFRAQTTTDVLAILVHEMTHLWQQHHGTPPRRCYHNHEWASKMVAVGLHPSDTGNPGGKIVGQRMTHYIIPEGPFAKACARLLATAPPALYADRAEEPAAQKKRASKTKYTCPGCGLKAWAKPDAPLACAECTQLMEAEDAQGDDAQAADDDE